MEMMKEKQISFEERDTTKDSAWRMRMINDSGQMSVPVFDIDGSILVGYNKNLLLKVLESKSTL